MPNGQKVYDIRSVQSRGDWPAPPVSEDILFPFEVVDVPNLNGQSVVANAAEQMGESIAAQRLGGGFFAGGSLFAFALTMPGKAGDAKKLRENMKAVHGDRRAIPVLEGGATLEKYGMPLKEAQFLESRQFYITEVARWYGIPPHKLRDLIRATFSNIAEQKLEWHEDLLPWLIRWEQELNRKLFPANELGRFYVEHIVEGLLRADVKARFDAYGVAVDKGFMNRNQVARKENLPTLGDIGEIYTVQGAMINLESILNPVEPDEDGQATATGDDSDDNANQRSMLQDAAQGALLDALAAAAKREAAEIRTLAEEPEQFIDRLDKFYARWSGKMASILRPCERVCRAAGGQLDAASVSADHCRTAHEDLLDLSGTVTPAELRTCIEAEVAEWDKTIPGQLAATVFGGSDDE